MRAVRAAAAGLVLAVVVAACGEGEVEVAAPQSVSDGLVPVSIQQGSYQFHESDLPVHETFAEAGPNSLAADGRLWELRKADRLIGVLQLTTLLPEIDLEDPDHRDSIVKQLLPTARDRFDIGDVTVWSTVSGGKTSYLWFGDPMFALLTVKPGSRDELEPETVLQSVLDHMVAARSWEYLYVNDEDDSSEDL